MVGKYEKALRSLWTGTCDAYIRETTINPANGRNEAQEVLLFQNEPCRLSFASIKSTQENNDAAVVQQSVKLFISKAISIPPGTKLVVTQNGKTDSYSRAGEPGVYTYHQEIALEHFKEWV